MFICPCPHLLWLRTATLAFSESFANGIRTKWQKTEKKKKKDPQSLKAGAPFSSTKQVWSLDLEHHREGVCASLSAPPAEAFCKRGKRTKCLEHPDVLLVLHT